MLVLISIIVIAVVAALVYNNNKKKSAGTIEKVESTISPAVKEVKEVVAKAEAEIANTKKTAAKKTTKK